MVAARKLRAGFVAAVLMFFLSGCYVMEFDFVVDEDLNVSGTFLTTVEVKDVELLGGSPADVFEDLEDSLATEGVPPGVTYELVDDGEVYGYRFTYDNVAQTDIFLEQNGPDIITREGDTIFFKTPNPLPPELVYMTAMNDPEDDSSEESLLTLSITFPGEIAEADGATINGRTATWDLMRHGSIFLTAQAAAHPPGISGLIIVLVALAVLAFAAIVTAFVVVQKKSKTEAPTTPILNSPNPAHPSPTHPNPVHPNPAHPSPAHPGTVPPASTHLYTGGHNANAEYLSNYFADGHDADDPDFSGSNVHGSDSVPPPDGPRS